MIEPDDRRDEDHEEHDIGRRPAHRPRDPVQIPPCVGREDGKHQNGGGGAGEEHAHHLTEPDQRGHREPGRLTGEVSVAQRLHQLDHGGRDQRHAPGRIRDHGADQHPAEREGEHLTREPAAGMRHDPQRQPEQETG